MKFASVILLRLVARNIQSIVDFMTALDARFDVFVAKKEAEALTLDTQRVLLTETYNNDVQRIDARQATVIRDKQLALSLKSALPKPAA